MTSVSYHIQIEHVCDCHHCHCHCIDSMRGPNGEQNRHLYSQMTRYVEQIMFNERRDSNV